MTPKQTGNAIMFLVASIFAINIPISKYLISGYISPIGLTSARISFAAVAFWITSFFLPQEKVSGKDHLILLAGSVFGILLNQGLFLIGLQNTSPVDASIIITSSPLFAMILAAVILKEPISSKKIIGVITGGIGAILLVFNSHINTGNHPTSSLLGNITIVGCSLFYAFYLVITKPLSNKYTSATIMKWMFSYSTIAFLPFTYKELTEATLFQQSNAVPFLMICYTLVGATFITYLLIPMAQRRIRPTTISMYNNLQPLIASFIAISMGMDHFSYDKIIAAILIFGGVYLVSQSKSKADIAHAETK